MDETRNTYVVYNASQEDQNYYRCIVTNKFGGSVVSKRLWLQVTRNPPHFTKHPMSQVVGLKSNFTNISLTCEAEGASTYGWERQYDSIPSSAIGMNTSTLTLINLQLRDAGQYRCVATNSSGSTESDYAVLILRADPSSLVTQPVDTSAAAPFSGVFTCSAYGYGYQHITWHKKPGILPYKHEIKEISSSTVVTSTLIIPNVTEQDVGKYYCQAWTYNFGTQSKQANLYYSGVPSKPVVEMIPGQLIKLTVNNFVLSMNCTFYTNGFEYKWEKKNETIISRAQGINSRQLTITNLKPEDSGEYRCILSNSTGVIISDYSLLTVEVALPVITRQPSSIVVQVFDIGSFECNARSYGDVSISWKRLNSKLPESINITESISLNEITSVLRLENVGYYKGYYYCVIENSVGTVNSALAHYDISVPCPEMILKPEPIKVRPDTAVTFSCVAWSYGGLLYEWSKNGSLTLPSNSTVFYEDKLLPLNSINTTMYEITIYNVQETDEGHYCCMASNDCGSTTKCAWLEVDTSPIITVQPTSRIFKYNKKNVLVFEIIATGVGHVYYLWQKYDSFTDSWVPLSSRAVNDTSPNLNFSIITKEDQGIYHCIVTNYDGSVTSDNVTITVFAAPRITYHSPATVSFEGNKVDLICNATNDADATDPVQVNWYYETRIIKPDGEYVVIDNTRDNATGQIYSVLSFDSVNYTNDGAYTCKAFNHPLSFTENKIQLTVEYPPRVNLNPPGPTYTVSVGTRLFLYCIAKGMPAPTIRWYENNVLIPQQSSPLYLALTDVPKVTLYTCEAKNNAGNKDNIASKSITVTVKKNNCPSLNDPQNGKMLQFSDGNIAIFSCDDGYTKKGNSFLHCVNGNWSSLPPTCLKSL